MQAKQLINSRLLSCFAFLIRLDFNASFVITLLKERLQLIINPFSSKFYMFFAVILYFLITIASQRINTHQRVFKLVHTRNNIKKALITLKKSQNIGAYSALAYKLSMLRRYKLFSLMSCRFINWLTQFFLTRCPLISFARFLTI